jgi:hypothetical protein
MPPSPARPSFPFVVISIEDTPARVADALAEHSAWVVVVRGGVPDDLSSLLERGADADVITISRHSLLARIHPDAVCWRRDHLAAVLASASWVTSSFTLLCRASRLGVRILDLPAATPIHPPFPLWADAIQQ